MTLTTRVSVFFLAAFAIALGIYSIVFYSVSRRQIHNQFEREMRGVLSSLVAAAEIEETEVKWQPLEHSIAFGSLDEFGPVEWVVIGNRELLVETSPGASEQLIRRAMRLAATGESDGALLDNEDPNQPRMVLYQRSSAPHPDAIEREFDEFDELLVAVGRSTTKRDAVVSRQMLLVTLLPLAAWLVAAASGRWMVRKALSPVSAMSQQARCIAGSDFDSRLSVEQTGDELTALAAAFNRLLDRQQAAFEQQRRFTGDAAHELRSPITVLLGQIDVALRRPRTAEEYRATLDLLRSRTLALYDIVESLLFLARAEGEMGAPHLQAINLSQWLEERVSNWASLPRASDLCVESDLSESVEARGTAALLSRIMDNLVSNALKYSDSGSVVKVIAQNDGEHAMLHVVDHGIGISNADQEQLFEPFFRSSDARIRGIAGNGMGLAIAKRIADMLEGSLEVESAPGCGSRFTLRLPLRGLGDTRHEHQTVRRRG